MVASIVAKYIPELKEKRCITGAMYDGVCPYCNKSNITWASTIHKKYKGNTSDLDHAPSAFCPHLLSFKLILENNAAEFIFSNEDVIFTEVEPTTITVRNFTLDGADASATLIGDLVFSLMYPEEHQEKWLGNDATDRAGITNGGDITARGEFVLQQFQAWRKEKADSP